MSTSIAALPAYKSTKATRTKARADRTIFGTTLDNSAKATEVYKDDKAHSAADRLFEERHKKWETPSPSRQEVINGAWGLKDYTHPEVGEEYARGYSSFSDYSIDSFLSNNDQAAFDPPPQLAQGLTFEAKPETPLVAYKNRYGVYNVLKENIPEQQTVKNLLFEPKAIKNRPPSKARSVQERRRRTSSMSEYGAPKQRKWSKSSGNEVQVPKFPLQSGQHNFMRTSSLKITETGAKDLLNARPINKIGLGETRQYNHESFKKREMPNQYKNHGNVFSLGQRGHTTTTNSEVTGPGGFYKMSTRERNLSEKPRGRDDTASQYSLPYAPSVASSRRTYDAARKVQASSKPSGEIPPPEATPIELDDVIPLNIIHKFGAEEVHTLLGGRQHEIKRALQEAKGSTLSHSGSTSPSSITQLTHRLRTTQISGNV